MMAGVCRVLGAVVVCLLLTACAGRQSNQYYALQSLAELQPHTSSVSIGIAPVRVPGWMDRSNLVWSDGGFRLHQKATDRWAEPLEDALTRITSQNLSRLFNNRRVGSGPWLMSESPDVEVRIEVLGLTSSDNQLRLDVRWELVGIDRQRESHDYDFLRENNTQLTSPLAEEATPVQFVEVFSRLLVKLAEDIQIDIKKLEQ